MVKSTPAQLFGLRMGIIGAGNMASRMIQTVSGRSDLSIAAVTSSNAERRRAAAAQANSAEAADIVDLIRTGIDLVYVASSTDDHYAEVLTALRSGVAVLCEKPLAPTLTEVEHLVAESQDRGVLLVEGMWSRYLPAGRLVAELHPATSADPVRLVTSTLGYGVDRDPTRRWFSPTPGSGAILDLGVYGLDLALQLLGPPLQSHTAVTRTDGVISQAAITGEHEGSALSSSTVTFHGAAHGGATIVTDQRVTVLEGEFQRAHTVSTTVADTVRRHDTSFAGSGLDFELDDFVGCFLDGAIESPTNPHRDTLALHRWLDTAQPE